MEKRLEEFLEGNLVHAREFRARFDDVQDAQAPEAVTIACSDSRVLQDHLWANETPGQLFTCSNIGNRVVQQSPTGPIVSGDVLYPLVHTGTELAIVIGHTGCGAITAGYTELTEGLSEPPGITHCLELVTDSIHTGLPHLSPDLTHEAAVNRLVEYNVDQQIETLLASEHVPAAVDVAGVVYDFQDVYSGDRGEVHVININGETSVNALKSRFPSFSDRIERLFEY